MVVSCKNEIGTKIKFNNKNTVFRADSVAGYSKSNLNNKLDGTCENKTYNIKVHTLTCIL